MLGGRWRQSSGVGVARACLRPGRVAAGRDARGSGVADWTAHAVGSSARWGSALGEGSSGLSRCGGCEPHHCPEEDRFTTQLVRELQSVGTPAPAPARASAGRVAAWSRTRPPRGHPTSLGDTRFLAARGGVDPLAWLRQLAVQQHLPVRRGMVEQYADLTVLDAPGGPAVLPLAPHRLRSLIETPRLVDDEHGPRIAQVLHGIGARGPRGPRLHPTARHQTTVACRRAAPRPPVRRAASRSWARPG